VRTLEAWLTRIDEEHGTFELAGDDPALPLTLSLGLWRGPLPLLLAGVEVACALEAEDAGGAAITAAAVKTVAPLRRDACFVRQVGIDLLCQGPELRALALSAELAHLSPAPVVGQNVNLVRRRNPRVPGEFLAVGLRSAPSEELEGVLNNWNARGFGIVEVAGRGTYLLPASEIMEGDVPVRGDRIRFQPRQRPGAHGPSATRARVIAHVPGARASRPSAAPTSREALRVNPAVRVQGTITSWVQHDDKAYGIVREANSLNTLTFVPSSIRAGSATPQVGRRIEFCHAYHPHSPGALVASDIVVFADAPTTERGRPSQLGASTRRATGHALNEDAFLVLALERGFLLAVADGTSMPVDTGWWSSDTALDILWQLLKASPEAPDAVEPAERPAALDRLMRDVQARYLETRSREPSRFRGACTTLAVAVIGNEGWLHAASVGDSRILLDDPGSQSFRDLDWHGTSSLEAPAGQLASAIGYPVLDVRAAAVRLNPGRVVALATDGVSFARTHASSGVYRLTQTAESMQAAADAATLESTHVGNDDATLLLFKYAPPAPTKG